MATGQGNRNSGSYRGDRNNEGENFRSGTNLINALDVAIDELTDMRERAINIFGMGQNSNYDDDRFSSNRGGGRSRNSNNEDEEYDGRTMNRGRRNFADSNDSSDGRTRAGRDDDDQEFSDRELRQFLRERPQEAMTEDGERFDRRTKIGRALEAAGFIDEHGEPVARGGNGGNRSRSEISSR